MKILVILEFKKVDDLLLLLVVLKVLYLNLVVVHGHTDILDLLKNIT